MFAGKDCVAELCVIRADRLEQALDIDAGGKEAGRERLYPPGDARQAGRTRGGFMAASSRRRRCTPKLI